MMGTISWILQRGGLPAAVVLPAWLWLGGKGANECRPHRHPSVAEHALSERYGHYPDFEREFMSNRFFASYLDPVPAFRISTPCVAEPPDLLFIQAVCNPGPPCPPPYHPDPDENGCCLSPYSVTLRAGQVSSCPGGRGDPP